VLHINEQLTFSVRLRLRIANVFVHYIHVENFKENIERDDEHIRIAFDFNCRIDSPLVIDVHCPNLHNTMFNECVRYSNDEVHHVQWLWLFHTLTKTQESNPYHEQFIFTFLLVFSIFLLLEVIVRTRCVSVDFLVHPTKHGQCDIFYSHITIVELLARFRVLIYHNLRLEYLPMD
jgi:hypothetical protein